MTCATVQLSSTQRGIVGDSRRQLVRCMLAAQEWWLDGNVGIVSCDEKGGKLSVATDRYEKFRI